MTPSPFHEPRTFHAPPERLPSERILDQTAELGDLAGLAGLLDCMPDRVMILNGQRQIIFGNKTLRDFADTRLELSFQRKTDASAPSPQAFRGELQGLLTKPPTMSASRFPILVAASVSERTRIQRE